MSETHEQTGPSSDAAGDRPKANPKDLPWPESLVLEKPPYKPRVMRVSNDRFYKQEYHDLEVERIWKKAWQWACREEEIPEIGDHIIYEVAELSFIVMRTGENEFKAYWNSCLHRNRKLRDCDGKRATELRCMFHGWAWNIDGTIKSMTCGYDFPDTGDEVARLPEARTGTWGGFVFINPDEDCEPLEDFLGELPQHFEGANHDFGKRWKQVHVLADIPANWKVAQEAFIEPWHAGTTHPQFMDVPDSPMTGIRWDDFGNWMRSAPSLSSDTYSSPHPGFLVTADTPQDYLNQHWDTHLNEEPMRKVEEGKHVLETLFGTIREQYRSVIGDKVDEYHDVHLIGFEMVHVFPNFHPWAGFSRLVYRFRPYKSDPNRSLMDVLLMAPWPEDTPRPPPAPVHKLGPEQPISDAPELGMLGRVFLQDIINMPAVQEGLKASKYGYVILGKHNDAPVRHLHDLYNKWMGIDENETVVRKGEK